MKNIRKHLLLLALTLLLAVAAVLAVPNAAEAAKSKKKSATFSVTDTKISGFEEITETVSLNNKYVIIFGENSKGKNVYAYSTDGKTFGKTKKLGLTGDISCYYSGKHLYVLANNNGKTTYKYVTNPAKLASARSVSIDADDEVSVYYWYPSFKKILKSTGKLYAEVDAEGHEAIIVLNKTSVSVTDLTAMVKKKNSGKTVGYNLKTGKAYTLLFQAVYNEVYEMSECSVGAEGLLDAKVYFYGSKLYVVKSNAIVKAIK